MATAAPTDNRVYLYRLLTLNIDHGTTIVRNLIDDRCSNTTLSTILAQERRAITNLRANRTITKVQFDLLYPQSGITPTTADFDLTLALCLLRSLKHFGLNAKFTWNVAPQPGDTSIEADLCRLRMYRNELAHISSTKGIQEQEFNDKWIDIEVVLHRLNCLVQTPVTNLQQIIDDCKNGPLDPEAEKKIEHQIEKMQKMEEKLEIEVKVLTKNVHEIKTDVHEAKRDVHTATEDVQKIRDEVHKVKENVHIITVDVHKIVDDVHEVKGDVHTVTEAVHEVKGDVLTVTEAVHEVQGDVHTVTEAVHEVKGDVHTVTEAVHEVKGDVHTVTEAVHEVKGDVHTVTEAIHEVKGNVHTVTEAVHEVKGDVHMVTEAVHEVKGDVYTVTEAVHEVKGDVHTVTEAVHEIKGDVHTVAEAVHEVKDDICTVTDEVRKLREDSRTTSERINELELKSKSEEGTGTKPEVQAVDDYTRRKEQLKDELAAFYKTRYSTIPLSPLFEEQDTPLVDFYILPEMNFIEKKNKTPAGEEIKTPVKSLSDVFRSEKSSEIYLTADAGYGKTAFSKYLAVTWCQAHRPEKEYTKYFKEDAIKAMCGFEFLFLVLLRDSSDDCSIDDLIVKQIMQNLSRPFALTIEYVQEVMHRERYLVILDGIDEWTHPGKKCAKVPKTIPHRNARETCVILTTTRPWKLGVLNLKTSEIDKKVELVKLNSDSAQTLEERAISKIKNLDVAEAKILAKQLNEKIKENKLEDLESIPLLTMYLICLWCDNIPLGQSKCGLYASIIELLLSRTISKHPEVELTFEPSQSDIPQCFSEHEHCTKFCTYLKALGQLAFKTLFSETKESILVFSKSVADTYLSPNCLNVSLYSGLLTQSTEKTLTKQISKLSFSHKTVQEFFCALYISCQNERDVKEIFLKECKSFQSILDMSTVLVFISGMNAEIISSISRNFMSVISEDKRTSEYRTTTDEKCKPLKDIQDMYISCMKENTSDKELKICCQDFFFSEDCEEEKYFKHLTQLSVDNKNNMASINILTYSGRSLRKIIDRCGLGDSFNINKIYYWGSGGLGENVPLPALLDKSTKCLTVISYGRSGYWSRKMWEILQNNYLLLQAIYIKDFWMSHDVLNDFLNYTINRKTMTEIRLWYLSCTEHKRSCRFNLDFYQHSDLRKLQLRRIPKVSQLRVNSQVEHVKLSRINLGEMSLPPGMENIKHVELEHVNMSASTLRDLVKVVEKLSHKVTVTIDWCKIEPETEFEHVKQYIHSSQNFQVTEDEDLWFEFETKVKS